MSIFMSTTVYLQNHQGTLFIRQQQSNRTNVKCFGGCYGLGPGWNLSDSRSSLAALTTSLSHCLHLNLCPLRQRDDEEHL